jgi:hypothetical protein
MRCRGSAPLAIQHAALGGLLPLSKDLRIRLFPDHNLIWVLVDMDSGLVHSSGCDLVGIICRDRNQALIPQRQFARFHVSTAKVLYYIVLQVLWAKQALHTGTFALKSR